MLAETPQSCCGCRNTDALGNVAFRAAGLAATTAGEWISVTATDPAGNTSEFSQDVRASYVFSGFLAPLSTGVSYALGRTIPVKFQLTDANGSPVTSAAAVTALQIVPINPAGPAFSPVPDDGKGLVANGAQFQFNRQTKGLSAGAYQIQVTLADGTSQTKTIQLQAGGGPAGLMADTTGASGTGTAGGLLGGDLTVSINDPGRLLTADEQARIADAIAVIDIAVAPYGVTITQIDPTSGPADVTIDTSATSAVGGYADGVLGCQSGTEVTLIQGWSWYAGSHPAAIGPGKFDLETVAMHELEHVLGLGHSADPASVMYATLAAGAANRALTAADLDMPDADGEPATGLHVRLPVRGTPIQVPLPPGNRPQAESDLPGAVDAIDQAIEALARADVVVNGLARTRHRIPTLYVIGPQGP
jgi:hypothetical protein